MIAAADLTACTATLQTGSRSFALASLFLPKRVRAPATALYAFCRAADDAIDLSDDQAAALDGLRARLDAVYAGQPGDAVDRAFGAVVEDFTLPRALPEALLEGFAWDVQTRRYEDLPSLIGYAMRVAGTVGVMMALLMGTRDAAMLSAACDLGCAMQLTNIARDVGRMPGPAGSISRSPGCGRRGSSLRPGSPNRTSRRGWAALWQGCWPKRRGFTRGRNPASPGCPLAAGRRSGRRGCSMTASARRWRKPATIRFPPGRWCR